MAKSYLDEIDALPANQKWTRVRQYIFEKRLPFLAELRERRPVMVLPELTLVSRFEDCSVVMRRHDIFGVDLYKPKQGDYFMAQDDTPTHWRDKAVMQALLNREDVPVIRKWVAEKTKALLDAGNGNVDLVPDISRAVPVAMVQECFGYSGADPAKLKDWSYWNQQDAFWNQSFDYPNGRDPATVVANRNRCTGEMVKYMIKLIGKRMIADFLWMRGKDPVSRLVRLQRSGAVKFSVKDVILNAGGLLIGSVETTSNTVVNALHYILNNPTVLAAAKLAAKADDPAGFDGIVFEALRFNPAFPYFFRVCHRSTPLAAATAHMAVVEPGTTVLAVTHGAMFDEAAFPNPEKFDPTRDLSDSFTFGQGLHECLGVAIGKVLIPEIVRQVILRPDLQAQGEPDCTGSTVPEHWKLTYAT